MKVKNVSALGNQHLITNNEVVNQDRSRLAATRWGRSKIVVAALLVGLLLGGCGDSESVDASETGESTDTTTPGTPEVTSEDHSSAVGSKALPASSEADLPGESFDGFAAPGDLLVVYGVAHDDVLNVRALPDPEADIVATADSTEMEVISSGNARLVDSGIWYEVSVGGIDGWANSAFLAFLGSVDDATADFLDGGSLPITASMQELGELVVSSYSSETPESKVIQTTAASSGDLHEIVYDVVGIGDDATVGYRLHIFAAATDDGAGFGLKSIERYEFCGRGVSDGFCV